ncbi:MAG: TlpA family protein disulfide reductase [Gammaproteobacteria bacterium]|nr:TlpA family protein disulfide reductase [Gammaproteobacteria bacterium]
MRHSSWIILAAGLSMAAAPAMAEKTVAGMPAPAFTLETDEGDEVSFPKDARGEASILLFWATWCPYCKAVMPYLDKIVDDYAEHGVQVFAIDFKDDGDPVAMIDELGYDFVVLPLGDLVADDYGVFSAPGILVVDCDGTVVYRRGPTRAPPGTKIAEIWDNEVREALNRALARKRMGN